MPCGNCLRAERRANEEAEEDRILEGFSSDEETLGQQDEHPAEEDEDEIDETAEMLRRETCYG